MPKKQDRLRPEGPTWWSPSWNGDSVDRFLAEELKAAGYEHSRKRTVKEANRAHEFLRRSWETVRDLRQNSDLLAPYWLPYLYRDDLQGTLLRRLVEQAEFQMPRRILDVGCGVGLDACYLAWQFPKSTICGTDCSPGMIKFALERMRRRNLSNAAFIATEHRHLPSHFETERFDLVYAHGSILYADQSELCVHLSGIVAVMEPGGIFWCTMPAHVDQWQFCELIDDMNLGLERYRSPAENANMITSMGYDISWSCAFALRA